MKCQGSENGWSQEVGGAESRGVGILLAWMCV
uniref:Uncharacterized protein n=1 Tax=Arundo donax TaxID=35708 RepID=A0A0A9AN22_ARUDO